MSSITYYRPIDAFASVNRLHRLVDQVLATPLAAASNGLASAQAALAPSARVTETPEGASLAIDLPGVRPEQLGVSVEGDMLTVTAEREGQQLARRWTLPPTVDASRIAARYEYGVLTVELPKAEQARPRQVAIAVSA